MHTDVIFSTSRLYGFLLVLARLSGIFVLIPLPGVGTGPAAARVVLVVALTVAVVPVWPVFPQPPDSAALMAGYLGLEAALGIGIGLFVAYLGESLTFAAQTFALQAGYAYASTIDPTTQADSGVLTVMAQLFGGMLFFAFGFHRELLRVVFHSLESLPPGSFALSLRSAGAVLEAGAGFLTVGLRLGLPLVALLVMADLALAMLSRFQQQLQLLSLAFPLKMLGTLILLAWMSGVFASVYLSYGRTLLQGAGAWVSR